MIRDHLPSRKTVRLQEYDYGSTGSYFITICSEHRASIFGEIRNGIMCVNEIGAAVWTEWYETFEKRRDFSSGAFVVMPNHIHGILHIQRDNGNLWDADRIEAFGISKKDTLATVMRGFKAAITSFALKECEWDGRLWQRGFHEHIIRDAEEHRKIEGYILNNARNWQGDCFYP